MYAGHGPVFVHVGEKDEGDISGEREQEQNQASPVRPRLRQQPRLRPPARSHCRRRGASGQIDFFQFLLFPHSAHFLCA